MSAGAIGLLLIALVLIDGRVREQIAQQIIAHPSATITETGGAARDAIWILIVAVRDQSLAHAPLTTFALAGGVLLIFMLRT